MKKFKKPLTINVVQDEKNQTMSPKNAVYKENKQRPLLMYNQHTIASSINNEDEQIEDRQLGTCEQFDQFHNKNTSQAKHNEENATLKHTTHKYKKFNVIQFEQFNVQGEASKSTSQNTIQKYSKLNKNVQKGEFRHQRKQFSIEIPQNEQKDQKQQFSVKFAFDIKSQSKGVKQNFIKQPPGPSNRSKISKSSNRQFVFPTSDEQNFMQASLKRQKASEKTVGKYISQEENELKVKQLNQQWSHKIQDVNKKFQKERQEFYKEKSNLEKDLMIKDGQIEMLQKLITNRYSPKQGNLYSSIPSNSQFHTSERLENYKTSVNDKLKATFSISEEKVNSMETILLEKDLEINSLLENINELNLTIEKKNNEIQDIQINLLKSQKHNESLKNQIYLYEKKQESQKLTKQFYKIKQSLIQVTNASRTPKGFSKPKWQQQQSTQKEVDKTPDKGEYPLRGIDDLHKRLESLKMNRIELQNRGKIKSEIAYSQTSKNKTKGTFDFKGKFYDRDRDYINHTRMY